MVKKDFTYRGKTFEELRSMSLQDFIKLIPSRRRRSVLRGSTNAQKALMKKIDKTISREYKKPIRTHVKDLVILPKMVGLSIFVHNGKEFKEVMITKEMVGHVLGEFTMTRQALKHSAPGIGATKSSSHQSVK